MTMKSGIKMKYTPYNEIIMKIKGDVRQQEHPIKDTKHYIQYEEKANNDMTV